MQYIDLRNCIVESTNLMCPACQSSLLQKIVPDGIVNNPDFKYYLTCTNKDCKFIGSPDVIQVDVLYRRLVSYGVQFLDFSPSALTGFDPKSITFDATSIGLTFDTYTWNFGDGSTVTTGQPQITHTYLLPGTYTVSVTVYDTNEHKHFSCSKINLITIQTYLNPVANFTLDKYSGTNKLTINCTDLSTGSEIIQWKWNFGDGIESEEQNPTHTYTLPGTYSITLTVTNSKGQTNTLTKPDVVKINLTAPVAKFTQSDVAGYSPLTVTFMYSGVNEYIVDTFKWSFGDGTTSTEQNPVHTYTTAGVYNVQLEVYNSVGSDAVLKSNAVFVEAPRII